MNQDASSGPQDKRLRAVITEYKRRRQSGQTVDQHAFLKAYPELADGLKQFFQGEASSLDPALASTKLGKSPGQDMSVRETAHPGKVESDTASEFTARMFGRYQLLRPLGEGAMGSVFLAQDTHLDRQVALKMPRSSAADKMKDRGEFLARFTREAKAAAGLKHPNICSVYDAGEIDGTAYITMDFIDGVPLSQLVGTDRLTSVSDVIRIIRVIADAVLHAHQKGIVHRDLKPGNILVDDQMSPFVTDFGLARRDSSSDGSRITQEGLLIGTPAYMAPEQVRGEQSKVGAVSDIYSLGVIFFELLTGRLPFEGSMPEMLAKVLRDPPPIPSRLRPDLTEDVDDVVWKMLLKEPDRRYQSMQDVITAIDKLSDKLQQATSRETTVSARATTAAAQSPFEIQKSHIELMLKKGQYAGAIRDLEALAEEKSPAAKLVVEWARKTLPNAKKEAKALSPSGLAAMLKTAEQMFEKCDYQGCIQLLDDVPSLKRSEAMETLLQKAQQREAAAEELMEQIRDKERRENPEGLEAIVKKYLKLKPGNAYAKKLMQALQTYSKTPAGRRRYRFERGRLQPMPEISFFRQYALLAVLVGVLSFLATYAYVIVYLKGGSQTIAVHVDDDWLREQGGQLTLVVDGDEHTISTSPSSGGPLTIVVKVGDREFSVKHGDAIVHNPRTFTIERNGRSVLQITPTDIELRNSPLIASGPIGGDSGQAIVAGRDSRPAVRVRIRPLTELNSSGLDVSAWVSSDGLRIYWEHYDSPDSEGVIFQAERKSLTTPFENKRQVLKGIQPALTDDELEIVYANPGSRGPRTLMMATRTSRSAAFSNAKEIDAGEPYILCNSPFVSSDGLTLTVNLKSNADNESTRYIQLRRVSRSAQWGGASELKVQWDAKQQGSPLTWIAMAADGLSFLATHEQDQGGFRVVRFQRTATDRPFERFEYLNLPGLPEVYGRTPRYVAATRELFLTAPAGYPTSRDANVWKNNYQGRLWVVEDVDLSAARSSDPSESLTSVPGPWIDLFDGKDTSKWQTLGQFQVENGLLIARNGKTMAVSKDEFADFELEVEWRLSGTTPNGGIYYRELATTQYEGNEYQLIDPSHRLANTPLVRTGALYGVWPTKEGVEKPLGEWNLARIVCRGPSVDHWLNNERLFSYDTTSDTWQKALSGSSLQRGKDRIGTARRGHILLQAQTGDVAYRKVRVRELSSLATQSPPATELDKLATGQWRPLVTQDTVLPEPEKMTWKNGVLSMNKCVLPFPEIKARNMIVRGEVRKMDGESGSIHLRTMKSPDPNADGGSWRIYNVWYEATDSNGAGQFGIGKTSSPWTTLTEVPSQKAYAVGDFIPMAFAVIDDRLLVFSEGRKIIDMQDATYDSGSISLSSWRGAAEYRNMEYQILDALPASDLDAVATGVWKPLIDPSTALPDPAKMKFREGVLELEADLLLTDFNIRNVIVRADVRKVSGHNVTLSVRRTSGNAGTPEAGGVHQYQLWFDGLDSSGGDFFGINKQRGDSFKVIARVHSGDKFSAEQFVDMAISAIGSEISFYVQGKKLQTVNDDDFTSGAIMLGAWRGKGLFRNVRYQNLDPANLATLGQNTVQNTNPVPIVAPFSADAATRAQEAWASYLKVPIEHTNSVGMKFRLIPPGEFTIGSSPDEIKAAKPLLTTGYDEKRPDRADSEGPQQRITISKPFYLGLAEVTQSQYQTVIGVNPSHYQRGGEGADKVGEADRSNAPVEKVSWLDTGIFCDRLSSHEGLASAYHTTPEMISLTGSGGYRLPTEAEWEYACRAGTETLYFSGNDEERLKEVAWTAANRQAFPQPVATRKGNPFGLYDMHGNAWEWVHDSWRANTYELMTGAGALDPRCDLGSPNWKVIRGGAYHYSTAEARSGCRDAYPADNRWHDTGFRVAVSVDAIRQKLVNALP